MRHVDSLATHTTQTLSRAILGREAAFEPTLDEIHQTFSLPDVQKMVYNWMMARPAIAWSDKQPKVLRLVTDEVQEAAEEINREGVAVDSLAFLAELADVIWMLVAHATANGLQLRNEDLYYQAKYHQANRSDIFDALSEIIGNIDVKKSDAELPYALSLALSAMANSPHLPRIMEVFKVVWIKDERNYPVEFYPNHLRGEFLPLNFDHSRRILKPIRQAVREELGFTPALGIDRQDWQAFLPLALMPFLERNIDAAQSIAAVAQQAAKELQQSEQTTRTSGSVLIPAVRDIPRLSTKVAA